MKEKDFEKGRKINYLNYESFKGRSISSRTIKEVMESEGINLDSEAVERAIRKQYSAY